MNRHQDSDLHSTKLSTSAPGSFSSRLKTPAESKIGPYTIVDQLGQGGMGSVFLAEQKTPIKRKVALKIIKEGIHTKTLIERFKFERQTLASLSHPNISKLLDVGSTQDGLPFFAMELVSGQSITKFCDQNGYNINDRLRVFRTACGAISYAHQNGVLHRDIKPSNILVESTSQGFHLKVIDFGLAKVVKTDKEDFIANEVLGTLAYMSPEQAKGDTSRTDTRSDVYSLGLVLYELLIGELPNAKSISSSDDDTRTVVGSQVKIQSIPSQQLESSSVDDPRFFERRKISKKEYIKVLKYDLDWILAKATAEEKENRYRSCDELIQDIDNFLNGDPISSHPPSTRYNVEKWIGRNRSLFAMTLVLGVILGSSLIGGWYLAWWARSEMFAQRVATKHADAARKAAEASEKRAKATLRLITNSFENLDPNDFGQDMMAGDALKAAYLHSENLLNDDPLGKAHVLATLGKSFLGLGEYTAGYDAAKKALAIYEDHYGPSHIECLKVRLNLISVIRRRPEYKKMVMEAKRLCQINFDPSSFVHQHIMAEYAMMLIQFDDKPKPGLKILKKIHNDLLNHYDPKNIEVLIAAANLATIQYQLGGDQDAVNQLYEIAKEVEKSVGKNHPKAVDILLRIAALEQSSGRAWKSEAIISDTLASLSKVLSERHPKILQIKLQLASSFITSQKFEKAESIAKEVLTIYKGMYGDNNLHTALAKERIARSLGYAGKHQQAISLQMEILDFYRKNKKDLLPTKTLIAELELGELYLRAGQIRKALKVFRKQENNINLEGDRMLYHQRTFLTGMARCLGSVRKFKEALKYTKTLLEKEKNSGPNSLTLYGSTLTLQGELQYKAGEFESAAKTFQEAENILHKEWEQNRSLLLLRNCISCSTTRAFCHLNLGQIDQYVKHLDRSIDQQWEYLHSKNNSPAHTVLYSISESILALEKEKNRSPNLKIERNFQRDFEQLISFREKINGKEHIETINAIGLYLNFLAKKKEIVIALPIVRDGLDRCANAIKKYPKTELLRMIQATFLLHKSRFLHAKDMHEECSQTADQLIETYQYCIDNFSRTSKPYSGLKAQLGFVGRERFLSESQKKQLETLRIQILGKKKSVQQPKPSTKNLSKSID